MKRSKKQRGLLKGARVYLSGPMDFVASRAAEKKTGWRNRIGDFLKAMDVTIFDPWYKPGVRGLYEYGREDEKSVGRIREQWTYRQGRKGAEARAWCARQFWESFIEVPAGEFQMGSPTEKQGMPEDQRKAWKDSQGR